MRIRPAQEQDLPGIAAIYDREVLHGIATFMTVPYSSDEWRTWLTAHAGPRHPALVAEEAGTVLGWATLSPWSSRQAYARAAESSVYVAPAAQGRGVGRALMGGLITGATAHGIGVIIARVVDQNAPSVRFHESLGFGTVGVMRRIGEKFGRLLDVRVMDLHLDGAGAGGDERSGRD
ncbi:MAG: N-acetyltransferase family protein [Leptolyngbya sp. PLA1]|nr:N-acetyltransferase family protein [Leptolyngbya sp. PLA1]